VMISGGLSLVVVVGLAAFVCVAVRSPHALREWVSTAMIAINHVQTFSTLASLDLAQPQLLSDVAAFFGLELPGAACIVANAEVLAGARWTAAIVYCSLTLGVLLGLLAAQWTADWRGAELHADQLEQALSIVFLVQFTTAYSVCMAAFRKFRYDRNKQTDSALMPHNMLPAYLLAGCTFLLELALLLRFVASISAFSHGARYGRWWVGRLMCSRWMGGLAALLSLASNATLFTAVCLVFYRGVRASSLPGWLFSPLFMLFCFLALVSCCCCSVSGRVRLLRSRRSDRWVARCLQAMRCCRVGVAFLAARRTERRTSTSHTVHALSTAFAYSSHGAACTCVCGLRVLQAHLLPHATLRSARAALAAHRVDAAGAAAAALLSEQARSPQ